MTWHQCRIGYLWAAVLAIILGTCAGLAQAQIATPIAGAVPPLAQRALPACIGNAQGMTTTRLQLEQATAGNWYAAWCRTATGWVGWTVMIDPSGAIGDTLSADDMVTAVAAQIAKMPNVVIGPGTPGGGLAARSGLVVAGNGKNVTRPSRYIDGDKLGDSTTQRAPVGAACDCKAASIESGGLSYCTWLGAVPNYSLWPVTVCSKGMNRGQ